MTISTERIAEVRRMASGGKDCYWRRCLRDALTALADAERRAEAAEKVRIRMSVYCTHLHRCELVNGIGNNPPRKCTCGLDAALADAGLFGGPA